jgi:hypothetical protein
LAGEIIGGLVIGGIMVFVLIALREGIDAIAPSHGHPASSGWKRWFSGEIDWSTTRWWQREVYAFAVAAGVALVGLLLAWIWPGAFDRDTVLVTALAMFVVGSALAIWRGRQLRAVESPERTTNH